MGTRTWTDEDLKTAVAAAKSWRGVLRSLGLNARSGSSIAVARRHARRLRLDTSHFSGVRKWSDQELREAVEVSQVWVDVLTRLGLTDERRTWVRVKGHALRLGLDVARLETPPSRPDICGWEMPADPSQLRYAAVAMASAWFAARGFAVAVPSEPQLYDLLVEGPTGIDRVQVKSTTRRVESGTWSAEIGHRPSSMSKEKAKIPYDPGTLDLFVIVTGDGGIYLIPIEAVAGLTTIYVSNYEQYRVGDAAGLLI